MLRVDPYSFKLNSVLRGSCAQAWSSLALILPLLFFLFSSIAGSTQTLPPKLSSFSPDDYGAHHQILCTRPLADGRTAFGTSSKFLIHHGEGFSSIPIGNGRTVNSMDTDSSGRIFVGGRSLVGAIVPDSTGTLVLRSLMPLLPDSLKDLGVVWNTVCTPEGEVYFNNKDHLFRYDGDTMEVIEPDKLFYRLFEPSERPIVYDVDTGLFRIKGTRREYLPGSNELTRRKLVYSVLPAADGQEGTWMIFTRTKGLYHYDPSSGAWRPFPDEEGLPLKELRREQIYTACRLDPSKNPYDAAYAVGTLKDGVHLLDAAGRIVVRINSENGLPTDKIWQVSSDGRGNIWAGMESGLALLQTGRPFQVSQKGKLFKGGIDEINRPKLDLEGFYPEGAPLFLATSYGIWEWSKDEKRFSSFEATSTECFDLLPYISHDKKGKFLFASDGVFSIPIRKEQGKGIRKVDTLFSGQSYSLTPLPFPNEQGAVFSGGRSGLKVFSYPKLDGTSKELLRIEEIPEGIRSTGWDLSGTAQDSLRLWAGMFSKGVLSIKTDTAFTGYRVHQYDTAHGLPEGEINVFSDPLSKGADVVFGTESGLYRFDGEGFVPDDRFGTCFIEGEDQIYGMMEGLEGAIWVLEEKGGNIRHLIPDGDASFRIDSTIFRSLNLGTMRSILQEEGNTWLGGEGGLVAYDPGMEKELEKEWHCLFREIRTSEDSLLMGGAFIEKTGKKAEKENPGSNRGKPIKQPLDQQSQEMIPSLPYSKNRMIFKFAAPFPDQQEAVEYSYKLVGFEDAWNQWTKKSEKEYTNLPEGDYAFKVKARNIYLQESNTAKYRFSVLPPWYRTWSAYSAYTIAGIAFIWLIAWLNSRRLIAQKQRLEKIVEERTKEIREQKEKVEEQQQETEKQKEEVEKQKDIVEEAHREITQSIDYAQKIQQALLQPEDRISPNLPEHFILFKPQAQVSGDFYWGKEHRGYFYIAAVDCTGHGVPGAFMSMLGISQLNEIMNTDEYLTPGYILTELRDRIVRELSGSDPESTAKDGMDAAIVRLPIGDHNSNSNSNSKEEVEVQFAGAQNPLYVIRKGIAEDPPPASMMERGERVEGDPIKPFRRNADGIEIKGDPQPVGYDESAKEAFTTITLRLRKGDTLYFFSDGYADQFGGPRGKKFRYGPFKQLLTELHEKALEEQKKALDRNFEDWRGEEEQIDDVVVIGVRL